MGKQAQAGTHTSTYPLMGKLAIRPRPEWRCYEATSYATLVGYFPTLAEAEAALRAHEILAELDQAHR